MDCVINAKSIYKLTNSDSSERAWVSSGVRWKWVVTVEKKSQGTN